MGIPPMREMLSASAVQRAPPDSGGCLCTPQAGQAQWERRPLAAPTTEHT